MEHVFPDALFQRGQNVPPGLSIEQTVEVGAFVGGEMLQQTGGLLFVHVVEKTGLEFFGKIAEQGGGRFSIQPSQQGKDGGAGKGGEFFRQVGRVSGFRHGGEIEVAAVPGQFTDAESDILTGHGMIPLFVRLKGRIRGDGPKGRWYCRGFPWNAPCRWKG